MSEENVEVLRRSYAAFNESLNGPNSPEALRAVVERFFDPETEWAMEPTSSLTGQVFHGVDGVMDLFDRIFDSFEQFRQVPERFIDCGDRVLVFVRTEARARTAGLELNEEWAHLIAMRDGKGARVQVFRNRDEALEAVGLSE